ncbi:hypothetical protein UA08_06524 [Talaromyces atroroseus]|uniref:Zn(2)-C6 fungal-type domain-containing protein n=1 Tax=Talaromyces atroroseus TaxID=1441469 RepID=A0A225AC55_TALAT|nr:hypothetical protein UA08_06524 [Talaromyces atroroseus]OKL57940.1 hypothetical protein UA08_06524 [Talaromyces atroroseus]
MSVAENPRLPTPQSFPSGGSSIPPESQQTHEKANPPPEVKEPTRARKACDECRRKKVKCEHGQQGGDIAGKRKRSGRTPAPSQRTTNQGNASDVNAVEHATTTEAPDREGQAQSSQTASERPRRLGAGKRKLSEAFDQNPPSNVSQRPRKLAAVSEIPSNANANTQQAKQRKKPGHKPRKQPDSASIVIPDTPETSPSPAERSSPQPQPFDGNITVSIDLAWHLHMNNEVERRMSDVELEWRGMCRDMENIQDKWQHLLESMYMTRQVMDEWTSRFLRQKQHAE